MVYCQYNIGNNAFGNIKMKIMHIRVGMYIELGLECILGWDEIRVRVLLEIIVGAISWLLNHVI